MKPTPIHARTLTPFYWHHIAIQGGSATIPEAIADRALCFALCAALGMMSTRLLMPKMDYRRHMSIMPWRASMLTTEDPRLLPPLAMRSDLGVEGGYPEKVRRAAKSGNFKEFFTIQEVPPGQTFRGAVFGLDPFEVAGHDDVVVRIGARRTGMLLLERDPNVIAVRLNATTARLFDRVLPSERYLAGDMQMTPEMPLPDAAAEVALWK